VRGSCEAVVRSADGGVVRGTDGQVELGRSGLRVSRLGLGTAPLGGMFDHVDDGQARDVVRHALDRGLTYLDTAPQYGHGTGERRLGAALAGVPRSSVVVSTKVGRLVVASGTGDTGIFADAPPSDTVFDFSPDGVRRSLEASLDRLGLDRVDIVYLHDPDDPAHAETALAQAYPVLHELRAQGVVRAIGVGMNQAAVPLRFVRETDLDAVLLAGRWSLIDRSGAELLAECLRRNVSVVIGGVFNSGLLADPAPRPGPRATFDYAPAPAHLVRLAGQLAGVCAEHGTTLPVAALQFPFRHPAVTSVLTGTRSAAELDANLAALDEPVAEALWLAVDAVLAQGSP